MNATSFDPLAVARDLEAADMDRRYNQMTMSVIAP